MGVASSKNAQLVKSFGAEHFFDGNSSTLTQELIELGPFEAVLAAADAAHDQPVLGAVLAVHRGGGGSFLSTMGLRPGVELPSGVEVNFVAIMDVYLDPKTRDLTTWVWWDFLESELASGRLQPCTRPGSWGPGQGVRGMRFAQGGQSEWTENSDNTGPLVTSHAVEMAARSLRTHTYISCV